MNRFAHYVVAAERKGQIAYTATYLRIWKVLFNPTGGIQEVYAIIAMLLDTGGNGQYVRVKNDILGWKAYFINQ